MLSVGMYVSCPIHKNGDTIYVLGKIKKCREETDQVVVVFFDNENINRTIGVLPDRQKTYFSYELIRAEVKTPAAARWKSKNAIIICELSSTKNSLRYYCIQYNENSKSYVTKVPESDLEIDFYLIKTTADYEASNFISCDTELFSARRYLSERKRYINSLEDIISTLVNTRINLYPHQIDAVIKATREGTTRIMLADEVGLGKTIEALTILKFHMQKNRKFRCLIVAPSSLEYQWSNETNERFGIKAESFSYNRIIYHKTNASVFIISYSDFKRYMYELDDMHWDMLIIDEAHKVLKTEYYSVLKRASGKIKNVILLSATPITHDGEEYLQLMKMINPARFGKMSIEQYRKLDQLQGIIRDKLFDMNTELELYNQIDMTDSFIMNLEDLNEDLHDNYLSKIINAISATSNDRGFYAVNLALEYIRKQYAIESNLIRHRRDEIDEARIERKLRIAAAYEMEGADIGVYESNVYDALLSLVSENINIQNKYKWIRLLEALHSSPYALLDEFYRIEAPGSEKRECFELIGKWEAYCDKEIESLIEGKAWGKTRFGKLIEVVNSCTAEKILVFSDFRETARKIYYIFQSLYGKSCVALFDSSMSRLDAQLAARKFQNDDSCRFIICDKSGGEGRNFQKADVVIHFDMSWSPAMMEQRIGRLDRIGRDVERDVESIVIYAADSIEEDIFNLYNRSLKVFSRSLCGLEIIFEELQEIMADSFAIDVQFGLSHAQNEIENLVAQMEESVEREIYFSTSNETSAKEQVYIREVSEAFEKECENEAESKIVALLKHAGAEVFIEPNSNLVNIDFEYADKNKLRKSLLYEACNLGEYEGTFRREYAVKHDSVDYFSTEHFLYQIAMNLVDKVQEGRFHAVSTVKDKIRWAGFVFIWNIDFSDERLFKGRLNPQKYRYIKKYLNEQQVTNIYRVYGDSEFNENEICNIFEYEKKRIIKGISGTVGYGTLYDEDSWDIFLGECLRHAKISAKERARSWLKREELADFLSRTRIEEDIEKHTVCKFDKKRIDVENTIMAALNDCELQIDSILYIEL